MRSVAVITVWGLLASGLMYLMFHPEFGLMYSGPMAAVGLGLLGGAICVVARKRQPVAQPHDEKT